MSRALSGRQGEEVQRKRGEGLPELLPARTRVFLTQRCTELAPGAGSGDQQSRAGGIPGLWSQAYLAGLGRPGGGRGCEVSLPPSLQPLLH